MFCKLKLVGYKVYEYPQARYADNAVDNALRDHTSHAYPVDKVKAEYADGKPVECADYQKQSRNNSNCHHIAYSFCKVLLMCAFMLPIYLEIFLDLPYNIIVTGDYYG